MGDVGKGYSKEGGTFVVRRGGVVDSGISKGSSYAEDDGLDSKRGGNGVWTGEGFAALRRSRWIKTSPLILLRKD